MSFTHTRGSVGSSSASTTVSVTLTAAPATGSLVCVSITAFNATIRTLNTVKDGNNNSYTITGTSPSNAKNSTAGSVWQAYLLSAPSNASATITATFSGSNSSAQIWADEFALGGLAATFDSSISGSGTGSTISSPTFTPTAPNELLFAGAAVSNAILDSASWTQAGGAITSGNDAAYAIAGTNSMTVNFNLSGSNDWDSAAMGFKQFSITGTPVTTDLVQAGGLSTLPSGESVSAGGTFNIRLPNKTLAGNCLVLGYAFSTTNTPTVTISDDKSNTWTAGPTVTDTTNHITVAISYALNVAANTSVIQLSPSTSTNFISPSYAEFANVATSSASDGSNGAFNATTGISVAPGSFTTTVNNDKILQFAFNTQNKTNNGWTPQTGFTLLSADPLDGSAMQYQIQSTAGAINPTLIQTNSSGWATVGLALKQATSGSLPASGIHVDRVQHVNTAQETSSTVTFQMPSSGNLLAILFVCGVTWKISSVSDNAGNSWQQVRTGPANNSQVQIFFTPSATPDNVLMVTCNMTGSSPSGHGGTFMALSISGADTSPLDTSFGTSGLASGTGNDTVGGNITAFTATPSGQNELILVCGGVAFNTVTGVVTPSGAAFLSANYSGQPEPSHSDENNLFAVFYNGSSTAAQAWTFSSSTQDQVGDGNWAAAGAAFKAPAPVVTFFYEDDSFNTNLIQVIEPIISVW